MNSPIGKMAAVVMAAALEMGLSQHVSAAQNDGAKPDPGPLRTISFEVNEGTWMSLDVSPDGKTILFDLLGDLYTLPIGGGEATLLLGGRDWDQMPRYSP